MRRAVPALVLVVASCRVVGANDGGSTYSSGRTRGRSTQSTPTATASAQPPQPRVITWSKEGSSSVVIGYDTARHGLAAAAKAANPDDAAWFLLDATRSIADSQHVLTDLVKKGHADIYHYKTEVDGTLDEAAMLQRVNALAIQVRDEWAKVRPKAHLLWKTKYGATSDDAIAKLEEIGKPNKVDVGKQETCWLYESDDRYCWTKVGKLSRHDHPGQHLLGVVSEGDCRAVLDKNVGECTSGDCRALLDRNVNECTTGDCRATLDKNVNECTTADCRARLIGDVNSCATRDCRGLVTKDENQCESQNCRALVTKNVQLCD